MRTAREQRAEHIAQQAIAARAQQAGTAQMALPAAASSRGARAAAFCVLVAAMLAFALAGFDGAPAFAAGQSTQNQSDTLYSAEVDPDATGSIHLTLQTASGAPVSGGQLSLYQVGQLEPVSGGYRYEYTKAFASCDDALTNDRIESAGTSYINELVALSKNAKAVGVQTAQSDGTVSFDNLKVGVYLVVQTKVADGYEDTNPFLVTIPMKQDGKLVYDVNATPKVGTVTPGSSSSSSSSSSTSSGTPGTPGTPGGNTPGTPGSTVPGGMLPQTGQLWWPVWLFGIVGAAFVIAGLALRRGSRMGGHES